MSRTLLIAPIVMVAVAAGAFRPAGAGAPTDQLRGATDRVLEVLASPELAKPAKVEERRKLIRAVANQAFDWEETAKRALARHWRALRNEQREEFSALFADLIERSYVGKIEAYSGEKIAYLGETVEGDQATVRTQLVTRSGTQIPIDYRMQRETERWRVYDVLIEGVSLVSNYRTQFNKIVQQSGYEDLLKKLKTKQEELLYEESGGGEKKP